MSRSDPSDPRLIRRRDGILSPDDLRRWPVWEFAVDEEGLSDQDELTLRPVVGMEAVPVEGGYRVAATFVLKDGRRFLGYVDPTPASGPSPHWAGRHVVEFDEDDAPVPLFITLNGPKVRDGIVAELDRWMLGVLGYFGKPFAEVFPIRVAPLVPVRGWGAEWELPGFVITDRYDQYMITEP